MNILAQIQSLITRSRKLWGLLFVLTVYSGANAQIVIGGDVYGGGKAGDVGTSKCAPDEDGDVVNGVVLKDSVKLAANWNSVTTATVTVYSGSIRTVFGGGENGRTYGSTEVTIMGGSDLEQSGFTKIGGQIAGKDWTGTIKGGVFGAGDGKLAYVFGNSKVTIGGGFLTQNIYGGGNQADLMGYTNVILTGGDIQGTVFGGSRLADIYGYSSVDIDGEHATNDLLISAVYGGNDIAGDISTLNREDTRWSWTKSPTLPTFMNGITNVDRSWNTFVHSSAEPLNSNKHIYVGQLYGGGNGDYDYTAYQDSLHVSPLTWNGNPYQFTVFKRPEVSRAYIGINGGIFGYVYGGGNAATVIDKTVISLNSQSTNNSYRKISTALLRSMGINLDIDTDAYTIVGDSATPKYQFDRVFGGNNKAEMTIQPTWNLVKADINNLYSGGNEGDMTCLDGLLLTLTSSDMSVHNVYGGCRKANVTPMDNGYEASPLPKEYTVSGTRYRFPGGNSARILITDGDITNVYGGNDISGNVSGGNAIHIHSSIKGDVYGGGNGSYFYTDQASLSTDAKYGDYYYNPGGSSIDALNAKRPNAERVYIEISGTRTKNTVIGGSLYCGGNSATLSATDNDADRIQLKIGAYVIADKVFLGNNGENMIANHILSDYADNSKSSLNLTDSATFAKYMSGVSMNLKPHITFDIPHNDEYTTFIGSFYCGGNVGSMTYPGRNEQNFDDKIIIYNKIVGGSNNAFIPARAGLNATFDGGILGAANETNFDGARIVLNFDGVRLKPLRLRNDGQLEWNTKKWVTYNDAPAQLVEVENGSSTPVDSLRLDGGTVYGGCYTSGHVNGNVIINILDDLVNVDEVFATETADNSGVDYDTQAEDVMMSSLYVYGGGCGVETEIWGRTTINIQEGFVFQALGGGEKGAIGKKENGVYKYNPKYSTYINLHGQDPGHDEEDDDEHDGTLAEAEYLYGGGFEGTVAGNTYVYLGNGRIYDAFGGACNADILGHSELYIGKALVYDSLDVISGTVSAFPWVKDNVYGGNDFGGRIRGLDNTYLTDKIRHDTVLSKVYGYNPSTQKSHVLKAQSYVEYYHGRVDTIYGGSYGSYDYTDPIYYKYTYTDGATGTTDENLGLFKTGYNRPYLDNAFVNIRPTDQDNARVYQDDAFKYVFGAGMGYDGYSNPGEKAKDLMQKRSYVLVDIPQSLQNFRNTKIFGSGAYSGVGMTDYVAPGSDDADSVSAVVDLVRGQIDEAYGGGYNEGITRRTVVNIPYGSTIKLENIFGGGYGHSTETPCDVYESLVNYSSRFANVGHRQMGSSGWEETVGGVYGGNNNSRSTVYATVNINSELWADRSGNWLGKVYGAGCGKDTWTSYTEVNLNNGALVAEAYGGGNAGKVYNKASLDAWIADSIMFGIGNYENLGSLDNPLVHENGLGDTTNTNIYINRGAVLGYRFYRSDEAGNRYVKINDGYAYGGGYGADAIVSGTTYIGLHGGIVGKDLYAGGTSGGIKDLFGLKSFTAQANAYIEGGSVRNVYGGGWEGHVGYTELPFEIEQNEIATQVAKIQNDILGRTNVIVGRPEEDSVSVQDYGFYNGVPSIERNVYAGGEGGAVFGTASLTINNGYIGYRYFANRQDDPETEINEKYVELINDDTWFQQGDHDHALDSLNRLKDSGNAFGGGYVDNSSVDATVVNVYGGFIRNSVYGGGEVAIIGRGEAQEVAIDNKRIRQLKGIYKSGQTNVSVYSGYINQNVFGGGKGFNNTGDQGTKFTNGYVFGTTAVNIYGGIIGTSETVALGEGNVFGGGNIGYVYNSLQSKKDTDGYYYKYDSIPGNQSSSWILDEGQKILSEDCRVVVSPYCKVIAESISLRDTTGHDSTFYKGEFVPTKYLLLLTKSHADSIKWAALDQTGIIIRNAIFAGGNVSSGNTLYANTKTVYGNATATLNDLYHTDLITLGTEHIGGLYGDGNLTRVDGYRELNITNYGTDYYSLNHRVTIEDYHKMNDRERAYFEVKYMLIKDYSYNGNTYTVGNTSEKTLEQIKSDFPTTLTQDNKPSPEYWKEFGFASVYAGRLINTIQRADFVGVFGSRMVLQGARDRVPETVDFTEYSLNRLGEVSLNRQNSPEKNEYKGNYFGIYNIANYLGALTSDVDFNTAVRTTSAEHVIKEGYMPEYTGQTYYDWKQKNKYVRKRNDGESINMVALASGVYLELLKENNSNEKIWGEVTGVLELSLINVMPGLGGGYVYAKNIHGKREGTNKRQVTLSSYNKGAISNKQYRYVSGAGGESDSVFQTSGNFVNSIKEIIDDCYPASGYYTGQDAAPAHYWYIKGQIYLYEQHISAYTGAADSYDKTVNIPLIITAGSNGKLKLLDVKTNKYAYWKTFIEEGNSNNKSIGDDELVIGDRTFHLNDTISYWDWSLLSVGDQKKFVDTTYVVVSDYLVSPTSTDTIRKGTVYLPAKYNELKNTRVTHAGSGQDTLFTAVCRMSNNLSHDLGYALTFSMTNPKAWDAYYTIKEGDAEAGKLNTQQYNKKIKEGLINSENYWKAPTYSVTETGVYGQKQYHLGDIITQRTFDNFKTIEDIKNRPGLNYDDSNDAVFDTAFVVTQTLKLPQIDGSVTTWYEGLVISMAQFDSLKALGYIDKTKADTALYCIDTWKLQREDFDDEYVEYGTSLTRAQIVELGTTYAYSQHYIDSIIDRHFSPAFYCTKGGKYGGAFFEDDKNYTTLTAWSSMIPDDRNKFKFNYDAFDLLIDPKYQKNLTLYDGDNNNHIYSAYQPIDYEARYHGDASISYTSPANRTVTIDVGAILPSEEYEAIPNEQSNYAPFQVEKNTADTTYYIIKETFVKGDVAYSVGNSITKDIYDGLSSGDQDNVDVIPGNKFTDTGKYYYCRNVYVVGNRGSVEGFAGTVTDRTTGRSFSGDTRHVRDTVKVGFIINEENYVDSLPNLQTDFTVYGNTPVETSTLYVSAQSDINDLSKGRIFTVIYQYSYEESDGEGLNIELVTERHIVNIYVQFKSGIPSISQINELETVLPGATMGLNTPHVTPGAYEVIGGGWEMFANKEAAENHVNGTEFDNTRTKLYWYEDGYYLAYYAKTYLGKTYSNAVPIKVGNYHDLDKVMLDTEYHMHVDHPNVKRNSKIYISDVTCKSDTSKNELDLFRDFYDLTIGNLAGHDTVSSRIRGAENIDFILKSDLSPKKYANNWRSIGDNAQDCFKGKLHGDGHTINGLTNSLFGHLCDSVFNLGVTGTFGGASSGIADHGGYAENTWVYTTGNITQGTNAVMGTGLAKNSYYPEEITAYVAPAGVTARPLSAFRNGEVAYDLNGFYLRKRYNDADNHVISGVQYKYYTIANPASNALSSTTSTAYYANDDAPFTYKTSSGARALGYVERRYIDGDFIYADGYVASSPNERLFTAKTEESMVDNGLFFPIWPDDYIFFGQMLTYGYSTESGQEYQEFPTAVNKANRSASPTTREATAWLTSESSGQSNRVYRAPAYFGNSQMSKAHFNVNAYLPDSTKTGGNKIYPGMTAIDFTGYIDSWAKGLILDFSTLTGIHTDGQTRNLVAYAPYNNSVLRAYFTEPVYSTSDAYGSVSRYAVNQIHGHLVELTGTGNNTHYEAVDNQLLVDKQNFNAPISYKTGDGQFMWYQRTPAAFVERTDSGWESISLPFTATVVTTSGKGIVTHFYQGSDKGHEYWLRSPKEIEDNTLNFQSIRNKIGNEVVENARDIIYSNTFLWDTYYSKHSHRDKNNDAYQTYYNDDIEYENYPFATATTPYLIGFPGGRYYEFDMSGQFIAQNTGVTISKLNPQTITFVSDDDQTIGVTDLDYDNVVEIGNYTYRPAYQALTVGKDTTMLLNAQGSKFVAAAHDTVTVPFRAYLTRHITSQPAQTRAAAGTWLSSLGIGYVGDIMPMEDVVIDHGLNIYSDHMNICIESTLEEPATVTITTVAGKTLKLFTIQPGTRVTVPVNSRGVYIVNRKKIMVTR